MYQMQPELLRVENLTIAFRTDNSLLPAVHNIQFSIREQETLAIVGESGCGKSITSFSIKNVFPSQKWTVRKKNKICQSC